MASSGQSESVGNTFSHRQDKPGPEQHESASGWLRGRRDWGQRERTVPGRAPVPRFAGKYPVKYFGRAGAISCVADGEKTIRRLITNSNSAWVVQGPCKGVSDRITNGQCRYPKRRILPYHFEWRERLRPRVINYGSGRWWGDMLVSVDNCEIDGVGR